jgi:DEAD/DEAH box helicase
MEAILRQYDEEYATTNRIGGVLFEGGGTGGPAADHDHHTKSQDVADAIRRFAVALRDTLPLFTEDIQAQQQSDGGSDDDDDGINARWLLRTLQDVPTELGGTSQLAKTVWDACHLPADRQEEALFAALGASEEAMTALFQIFPHTTEIANNIMAHELGGAVGGKSSNGEVYNSAALVFTQEDPEELERQRLRQEAYDTAQVAAIAQAEVDALRPGGGSNSNSLGGGATHSIARSSELEAQKAARKAQKRAAQAMARAKAAGAIIDDEDFMSLGAHAAASNNTFGQGGLVGRSADDIASLQQSLLPEGSRKHYNDKGLPNGTERYDDDVIGYERVTIPPPRLDPSKLHARLRIDDVLDPDCAKAFAGTTSLNPMQSTVFDTAFHRRENMLVCAPTGAGKTNVAMLTVTAHFRDVGLIGNSCGGYASDSGGTLETGRKAIYIAPMKALAQEVVEKFSSKLKPLGLIVRELTGDMQLTRAEAESANVIGKSSFLDE